MGNDRLRPVRFRAPKEVLASDIEGISVINMTQEVAIFRRGTGNIDARFATEVPPYGFDGDLDYWFGLGLFHELVHMAPIKQDDSVLYVVTKKMFAVCHADGRTMDDLLVLHYDNHVVRATDLLAY